MKKEDSAFTLYAAVCSLLMLAILFLTLFSVRKGEKTTDNQETDILTPQTEYIYVYVSPNETSNEADDTNDSNTWIDRKSVV